MRILTKLLQDTSLEIFLKENFTRTPYSRPYAAKDFTSSLDWKVIEKIAEEKKSIFRIVKEGKHIKDSSDMQFDEAMRFYEQGNTILVRYAEKSSSFFSEVAKEFSQSFNTNVDIQLYCTPHDNNAFGWHYDIEEVFIIQAKGSKEYTLRPNTIHPRPLLQTIPKDLSYEKEKGDIYLRVLLEEGDWLYIPSGWWHIARTQKESMHISIGLMPTTLLDILDFLPQYLMHNTFWRTRIPFHNQFNSDEERKFYYEDVIMSLSADLRHHLMNPNFVHEFIHHIDLKK